MTNRQLPAVATFRPITCHRFEQPLLPAGNGCAVLVFEEEQTLRTCLTVVENMVDVGGADSTRAESVENLAVAEAHRLAKGVVKSTTASRADT